jgi:hypothetical protein
VLAEGSSSVSLSVIDISEDDRLIDQYGLHIPVLCQKNKQGDKMELFWPFDEKKLRFWLAGLNLQ